MLDHRFTSKFVVTESGCWEWIAAKDRAGYGVYARSRSDVRETGEPRNAPAHRFAYEAEVGPAGNGMVIDHLCRNHACVNPAHLEAVTHAENVRRGAGAGQALWNGQLSDNHISRQMAAKTHCPSGHPYSEENTYYENGNHRRCRQCRRNKDARKAKRDPNACRNGHDRSETRIDATGRKVCRLCVNAAAARWRAKNQ